VGTKAHPSPFEKSTACIARQPILTADETVVAYELFFRENRDDRRFTSDGESATSATIDTLNLVGLGVLCDGRTAFVNCTHRGLVADSFALLSPKDVVIEIQPDVPPEPEVLLACQRLRKAGYAIALDNFVLGDPREELIRYAGYIKADITKVPASQLAPLVARYKSESCTMLAHKVETREQFLAVSKAGFTRFQGYFFRHPEAASPADPPPTRPRTYAC
jgi:EAL and modified HD-GYP domain-containing signal transduction protein